MKTRKEAVEYINTGQMVKDAEKLKHSQWHVGTIEFRMLMDYIYGGDPEDDERIKDVE